MRAEVHHRPAAAFRPRVERRGQPPAARSAVTVLESDRRDPAEFSLFDQRERRPHPGTIKIGERDDERDPRFLHGAGDRLRLFVGRGEHLFGEDVLPRLRELGQHPQMVGGRRADDHPVGVGGKQFFFRRKRGQRAFCGDLIPSFGVLVPYADDRRPRLCCGGKILLGVDVPRAPKSKLSLCHLNRTRPVCRWSRNPWSRLCWSPT